MERFTGWRPGSRPVILVHDGAYAEFEDGFDGGASLVDSFPNVVMTRTFSKIHGLGGLRIGWGYAQREIVDVLNRIRQPFNLSNAQLAAAEAAIRDTGFASWCRAENARLREWLRGELARAGVLSDLSHTNFVLARFRDAEEAEACDAHLRSEGILVRRVAGYGLPHCLRMTVGDEAGTRRLVCRHSHLHGEKAVSPVYDRVALIGLGLIASSMSHAIRRNGLAREIVGTARSEETRRTALEIGLCDRVTETAAEPSRGPI
jgi:hypothetical protein